MDFEAAGEKRKMQLSELQEWWEKAYHNAKLYKERTKRCNDKRLKKKEFKPGDKVLLFNSRVKLFIGMKMVRTFFDRIRGQIHLEGFKSIYIQVWIFNIQYYIWILKSHIYDADIQSYPIQHGWHYPYSNPNLDRNMKTNIISVISVRIRSIFIPSCLDMGNYEANEKDCTR
jgi:hypothetical protein